MSHIYFQKERKKKKKEKKKKRGAGGLIDFTFDFNNGAWGEMHLY